MGRRRREGTVLRVLAALILLCTLLFPIGAAASSDTLVVQSRRDPIFDDILRGFQSVRPSSMHIITLADYSEADITRLVREEQPRLILTLGDTALNAVKRIRSVPVISLMSLNLQNVNGSRPNLSGISMLISPERYIPIFSDLRAKRVGILYNSARSGAYVRRASQLAARSGIVLVLREVRSSKETQHQLTSLSREVDALWMIPDPVVVTQQTAEAFFHFSQRERIPVIAFASIYLSLGSSAVLEVDRFDMGKQAAEMALKFSKGIDPEEIPMESPRRAILKINRNVLRRLGIAPEELE